MAVNDILRSVFEQNVHDDVTVLNVLHWRVATVGTGQAEAVLASALDGRFATNIKPRMDDAWEYEQTSVQKIYPAPTGRAYVNGTGTGVGGDGSGGGPITPEVAYTVTLRTQYAGPKYRGRLFVTGFNNTHDDYGELNGTFQGLLQTAWEAVIAAVSSSGYSFVPIIYHKATATYDSITDLKVQPVLRAQRRRQTDRGI